MNHKRFSIQMLLLYAVSTTPLVCASDHDKMPHGKVRSIKAEIKNTDNELRSVEPADVSSNGAGGENDKISFGTTLFTRANNFFLGADDVDVAASNATKTFALSRVENFREDAEWKTQFVPLAPAADVKINAAGATAASPFNNVEIFGFAKGANNAPVVAIDGDPTHVHMVTKTADGKGVLRNAQADDTDNTKLQHAGPADAVGFHGLTASQNAILVNNAGNATSMKNVIFSAVSSQKTWQSGKSNGIAVVQVNDDHLLPVDSSGNGAGTSASAINFGTLKGAVNGTGFGPLALNNNATMGNKTAVDVWWDQPLQRLFIAFNGIATGTTLDDAVVGLAVGQIDALGAAPTLKATSVLGVDANGGALTPDGTALALDNDDLTYGVAVATSGADETAVYLNKVRTMHTSTGKDYVILNGGVAPTATGPDALQTLVFALPVMPSGNNAGKLADIFTDPKTYQLPTDQGSLLKNTGNQTAVGSDPRLISANTEQSLTAMDVIGDTVYVSVAGDRYADDSHDEEAGMFASTALFDNNGNIRAWTPWQRVSGFTDPIAGFGLDTDSQKIWYLQDDKKTVKVTQWNAGDEQAGGLHDTAPLSATLTPFVDAGGISNIVAFDGATQGFKPGMNNFDQIDMLVATGNGRVALIQSGLNNARGLRPDVFDTTQKFVTNTPAMPGDTVFLFSGGDLDLGNITSAEVSRVPLNGAEAKGWLFVGGDNGLAVLRADVTGDGWSTAVGAGLDELTSAAYPATGFAWKQLKKAGGLEPVATNIRKIISSVDAQGQFLYVLTNNALHRIEMNAADFASGTIDATRFKTVIDLAASNVIINPYNAVANGLTGAIKNAATAFRMQANFDEFFDVVLVKRHAEPGTDMINNEVGTAKSNTTFALATTRGVAITGEIPDNFSNRIKAANKPFLKLPESAGGDNLVLGAALKFEFANSNRGGQLKVDGDDSTAEGNLHATALGADNSYLAVYRFDVNNGAVSAIKEPYLDADGNRTDYFYKVGDIDPAVIPYLASAGLTNFAGNSEDYGSTNSDFVGSIPVTPNPNSFLNAGKNASAINLGLNFGNGLNLSALGKNRTVDPASGAIYYYGDFGVLVNE